MQHVARQIYQQLLRSKKILIIPHQNPDGDALGSVSALAEHLISIGKKPYLFSVTPVEKKLLFLAHADEISTDKNIFEDKEIDTIVIPDSGDLKYAGVAGYLKNHPAKIVNIDHHPTNEKYGHFNLVIPSASSTTEILYYFFKKNNLPITHVIATSLLTGLVTDTDNFSNPATSISSLSVASDLLRRGGNLNLINRNTLKNKSVNALKLWGTVLTRLTKVDKFDLVYTYITNEDIKTHNVSESEAEGIANFLNNTYGVKISLILRETKDGKIKASLRTTLDNVDVSLIAKKMGGGGHKKAAGFTAEGTIDEVLNKLFDTIQ